jgi:uncharacterized cupin superfamily protein
MFPVSCVEAFCKKEIIKIRMRTKYGNIIILDDVYFRFEFIESGPSSLEYHAESHGQSMSLFPAVTVRLSSHR